MRSRVENQTKQNMESEWKLGLYIGFDMDCVCRALNKQTVNIDFNRGCM